MALTFIISRGIFPPTHIVHPLLLSGERTCHVQVDVELQVAVEQHDGDHHQAVQQAQYETDLTNLREAKYLLHCFYKLHLIDKKQQVKKRSPENAFWQII